MFLLRLILKILACPVMIILMLIGWILAFLISFSSIVFYVLAGLFLLTSAITYLMGLTAGPEVLKMTAAGFVCFITPQIAERIIIGITAIRCNLASFIRS